MSIELDNLITPKIASLDIENEDDLALITSILKKKARLREKEELVILYSLIRNIPFFERFWKEFPSDVHMLLLKELQYENVSKGGEVFKAGDDAKNFYIILRGSVFVLAPHKDNRATIQEFEERLDNNHHEKAHLRRALSKFRDSPAEMKAHKTFLKAFPTKSKDSRDSPRNSDRNLNRSRSKSRDLTEDKHSNRFFDEELLYDTGPILSDVDIMVMYPNHAHLNTLKTEDHFGEIALTMHVARTATVVARENCQFLYLSNSAYRKTLKFYKDQFETEAMEFLKSNPLTCNWPNENLAGILRQSKGVIFSKGQDVYKPGDNSDAIYFIREGELELSRQIELNKDPMDLEQEMKKENKAIQGQYSSANSIIAMNSVWKKKYNKLTHKTIRCAILGRGEMFGDEELIKREEKRQFRALVKSFTISLVVFPLIKLLENAPNPAKFLDSIVHRSIKQVWRGKLTKGIISANLEIDQHKIQENKEHFDGKIQNGMIPVDNIKGYSARNISMRTASLGTINIPLSPKQDSQPNSPERREYFYSPLPGKSKDALKMIDHKQKLIIAKLPFVERDASTKSKGYLQFNKHLESKTVSMHTSILEPDVASPKEAVVNLKKKFEEFLHVPTDSPTPKYIINPDTGNESPTQKIRSSIKRVTKLWEKEYSAFVISPKRYNSIDLSSPTESAKIAIENKPNLTTTTTKYRLQTPAVTPINKIRFTNEEKNKIKLYKSLKLEKVFAPPPQEQSLEEYMRQIKNETSYHFRKRSMGSTFLTPKSSMPSRPQTHRPEKNPGLSRSSTQVSFKTLPTQHSHTLSSFKGKMIVNKKK